MLGRLMRDGEVGCCKRVFGLAVASVFSPLHPYCYMWPHACSLRGPPRGFLEKRQYTIAFLWFFLSHVACIGTVWYFMLFTELRHHLSLMRTFMDVMGQGLGSILAVQSGAHSPDGPSRDHRIRCFVHRTHLACVAVGLCGNARF